MATKRTTRRSWNYDAPCLPTAQSSKQIIADYERGCHVAAWMFAAMFAFMALGAGVLGW